MIPILDITTSPATALLRWLPELVLAVTFLATVPLALSRRPRLGWLGRWVGGLGLVSALVTVAWRLVALSPAPGGLWADAGRLVATGAALLAWLGSGAQRPAGGDGDRWPGRCGPFLVLQAAALGLVAAATSVTTASVALLGAALCGGLVLGTGASGAEGRRAAVRPARAAAAGAATVVFGLSWLVALTGVTEFAEIHAELATGLPEPWPVLVACLLVTIGLFFLVVPPALAHTGTTAALVGFLASAPPVIAVLFLWRVIGAAVLGPADPESSLTLTRLLPWHDALGVIGLVAALGFLVAARQTQPARLLAWGAVGQVGLALVALSGTAPAGPEAAVLQLGMLAVAGPGAFLALGVLDREGGTTTLAELAGRGRRRPGPALAATVFLLALAGMPLLAGFPARVQTLTALLAGERQVWAVAAVVLALAGAVAYLRVVAALFRPGMPDNEAPPAGRVPPAAGALLLILVGLTVAGGVFWQSAAGWAVRLLASLDG